MIFMNRRRIKQNSGIVKDPTKYWYIEKYVYGKLKETAEIPLGTKYTFGSLESGYEDDTFYGWTRDSTSTSRNYQSTSSYNNTSTYIKKYIDDENTLKVYAIYKYTETHEEEQSVSVRLECSQSNHTIIVKDAIVGTKYSVYEQEATISQSQSSNGQGGVIYSPSFGFGDSVLLTSGTTTSSTISYTFNYRQVSGSVLVGNSSTGYPTTQTFYRDSPCGTLKYISMRPVSTAKYRVESHT